MPVLKMMNEPYRNLESLHNLITYIAKDSYYLGSMGVSSRPIEAEHQMQQVKEYYYKTEGRQVRHFIVSFGLDDNMDEGDVIDAGYRIACYYGHRYQIFWGAHWGTDNLHIHYAMNTVSYLDGKMYACGYEDFARLKEHIQQLFPKLNVVGVYEQSETGDCGRYHRTF